MDYILGAGRSGSTLLDTILGSHPSVEGLGELAKFATRGLAGEFCACGIPVPQCPFWRSVLNRWEEAGADVEAYAALQGRVESLVRAPHPGGLHLGSRRYADMTAALFRAIAETSGSSILVDSSKQAGRAMALSSIPGIDVRFIHLVRDARGVVSSRAKSMRADLSRGIARDIGAVPPWRTALLWCRENAEAEATMAIRRRPHIRIRYEDLTARPRDVLFELGELIGADYSSVGNAISAGTPIRAHHAVAGNRLRLATHVRLAPDIAWQTTLSGFDQLATFTSAGILMRRYGYRWNIATS